MFVSDYFELDYELEAKGVFDSIIDKDSHYFINLVRLKKAQTPEFRYAYQRINDYFTGIATLLNVAEKKDRSDKFYREALRKFDFSELNGINLGFPESLYGAGFGRGLRSQVINDTYDIVKAGSTQPEIFQLVGLFEENVGPDRLSDMIATIIQPDIISYTKRILTELEITPQSCPQYTFDADLVLNPYKGNCPILLLPVEILHELPIAQSWDDIDRVVSENESIRREINDTVGKEWSKWASGAKKAYIKNHIFKNPERCARVIEGYRGTDVGPIDFSSDLEYLIAAIWRKIQKSGFSFAVSAGPHSDSFSVSCIIMDTFKDWVENNRGWDVIQSSDSKKREKIVQRLVHLAAKSHIESNGLDISFEPDEGRGPVDFKVSRGADKTIVEIKLSTNQQYLHGYERQILEYGKAENTQSFIYVFIDLGNPGRLKTIQQKQEENIALGKNVPHLVVIDSRPKDSASKTAP